MKNMILASAAVAALIGSAQPAFAASASHSLPQSPTAGATSFDNSLDGAANAFLAHRSEPMFFAANGQPLPAAAAMLSILDRAPLDGMASGPLLSQRARQLLAASAAGDKGAMREADRLLSVALVQYAQTVRKAPIGMDFANSWVSPTVTDPQRLLATAAAAPSLDAFLNDLATVNPVYAELRDAAYTSQQAGIAPDQRVRASLDRARIAPNQSRYVMVDAASAMLYMVENGRVADRMKVIVGKSTSATPMIGSTIYHTTLNPYWHVPDDLAQTLIGPRVVEQGVRYLTDRNYDVLSGDGDDAVKLDPADVDWKGVVAGTVHVRLRQRPNPANSMGTMKFGFANDQQIFLHDSPNKALFAEDARQLSNGCIRLEDAPRFARWLMAGKTLPTDQTPELAVALPTPVPVYVTYLTAQATSSGIAYVADKYGYDTRVSGAAAGGLR